MFGKLGGTDALGKVVLVTTMWGRVNPERGASREEELRTQYWRQMIANGSCVLRFEDSFESAWSIVDKILEGQNT